MTNSQIRQQILVLFFKESLITIIPQQFLQSPPYFTFRFTLGSPQVTNKCSCFWSPHLTQAQLQSILYIATRLVSLLSKISSNSQNMMGYFSISAWGQDLPETFLTLCFYLLLSSLLFLWFLFQTGYLPITGTNFPPLYLSSSHFPLLECHSAFSCCPPGPSLSVPFLFEAFQQLPLHLTRQNVFDNGPKPRYCCVYVPYLSGQILNSSMRTVFFLVSQNIQLY